MGRRVAFLALVTAALLWPGSALAATGQLDNGTMVYTAGAGESNSVVFVLRTDPNTLQSFYEVQDAPAVDIAPTPPCQNGPNGEPNVMDCPTDGGGQPPPVQLSVSLGDGNDSISIVANLPTSIGAGGGQDTISGGPATDFLRGGQGDDKISGGGGNDQLTGDDPGVSGGGNDSLDGGDGNDTEDGQDGNDTVRGGQGNDTLTGGNGDDNFPAESTNDGADDVSGGPGIDTASFAARSEPVQISLDDQANDGTIGSAADNIHSDVEDAVGGSASDVIDGSGAANALDGGAGDDAISGEGGDDTLTGDAGNDTESGGDGSDTESGGDGNDTEAGGEGADTLNGDAGDDTLDGGGGPDVMDGGDGTDTGDYRTRTAGVAVTLDGQPNDGQFGEADNVEPDVENVDGGSGDDTLIGSAAANTLDGGAGEDYSDGGPGDDTLVGGASGDVMRTRGSSDPDTVTCGPGPDFVVAKPNDVIAPDCDRADRGVRQKPKLRDSAVVTPVRGTLQMSPTGIVRRVPLLDKVVLPLRSIVDTVGGAVTVTSSASARKTQTASLDTGAFDITQATGALPTTQFALQGGDFSVCPARAGRTTKHGASAAASKNTVVRSLWAKGKGAFRTKGRYASASIRGTKWQTVDRCDGTLIRVRQGAVTVRDLVKKKNTVVKAGHTYLAKAR